MRDSNGALITGKHGAWLTEAGWREEVTSLAWAEATTNSILSISDLDIAADEAIDKIGHDLGQVVYTADRGLVPDDLYRTSFKNTYVQAYIAACYDQLGKRPRHGR